MDVFVGFGIKLPNVCILANGSTIEIQFSLTYFLIRHYVHRKKVDDSRLGVRQSPFLSLCVNRHTFVYKSFWAIVCRRIKPLLRKNLYEVDKIREIHFKISRFIVTFAYEEFFKGYVAHRRIKQQFTSISSVAT